MKKILKKLLIVVVLMFVCVGGVVSLTSCSNDKPIIAIVKYVTHQSLDEIEEAIKVEIDKELTKANKQDEYVVKTYDCAGKNDLAVETMNSLKNKNVACVIAIDTPVPQVA